MIANLYNLKSVSNVQKRYTLKTFPSTPKFQRENIFETP